MHTDPLNMAVREDGKLAVDTRILQQAKISFLTQKAKGVWIADGDDNTKFFHSCIRARRAKNKVIQIKDAMGNEWNHPSHISEAFRHYYIELMGTQKHTKAVHNQIVRKGGPVLNNQHHSILLKPVTGLEIKEALFSIPGNKAPGPDGYSTQFFKDSWHIVGDSVIAAVQEVFQHGKILKQLNATILTLIPKKSNPMSVTEFRPIACCTRWCLS